MAASNYDDVLDQLRAAGLIVSELRTGTPRPVRCKVEGDREKRGWYRLHELTTDRGDLLIVGSFGAWHGNDNTARKVDLRKTEISIEQREALKKRLAEDRRQAEQERRRDNERAAQTATMAWAKCAVDGDSEYLTRKGVPAYGVRFSPSGALAIPMCDSAGRIHGLQVIRTSAAAKADQRPAKEYWPAGLAKKGHFHLIGAPHTILLITEGYATGASLHLATGYPVAIAFDAGNLGPVAAELHKRYPRARILVCADDDSLQKCIGCKTRLVLLEHPETCPSCGQPHGSSNAGVAAASAAALEVNGAWIKPVFADEPARVAAFIERGIKLTDFNDLHVTQNALAVGAQIEARLRELKWGLGAENVRNITSGVEGAGGKLRPIQSVDQLLKRYSLVYAHSGAVFDRQEHCLLSLSDMRDACIRRDLHRSWSESADRDIVRIREVGFDPAGDDPEITCNLYAGWPTTPKAGKCERLLDLLRYMCSGDQHSEPLFRWVLRWIAFPVQHPGAKMKSTLVLHGPQGTGKNLFFEAVMAVYGLYGDVIDQSAIEDKFNDWASRKLFLIADEVVARSDLYHVKNKLKALITGERIRINPKNFAAYWERNHVNLVFLSNEAMPVVLEEDDRRHCVIWTPEKREPAYYQAVMQEIREGGIAALHDYLLHLDLGEFTNGSLPPITGAKSELIGLALDSPQRFHDALITGDIDGLQPATGKCEGWFRAYELWCRRMNLRSAPEPKFVNALKRQRGVATARERYMTPSGSVKGPHSILFLGDRNPPEGTGRSAWLGDQVFATARQVEDFREAK